MEDLIMYCQQALPGTDRLTALKKRISGYQEWI